MEDFSQSRGDDDLFDDEIIPLENPPSPEKVATQLEQASLEPTPAPAPAPEQPLAPAAAPTPRDSNPPDYRGKPRGRGGQGSTRSGASTGARGGLSDSKWAPKPAKAAAAETSTPKAEEPVTSPDAQKAAPTDETSPADTPAQLGEAAETTAPTVAANARTPAVRGDRSATGGMRKPKLTEEELSAKLAAAKERSQNLAAAHARAQADAASFEERERLANQKREKDRVQRKAMDKEREKNRQRKMGAMGGREWDAGKNEEDFSSRGNGRGGSGGSRRVYQSGMTPEQQFQAEQDDLRQYEWHEDRGRGGRGRGGRWRGGRGRGRGGGFGRGGGDGNGTIQPDLSATEDFPALPGAAEKKLAGDSVVSGTPRPTTSRWDSETLSPMGDGGGGGSWAEQVESSEAVENKETRT
ncbi:hypothetical protein LTR67_009363 [Exophiala xenobiotica]